MGLLLSEEKVFGATGETGKEINYKSVVTIYHKDLKYSLGNRVKNVVITMHVTGNTGENTVKNMIA